MANSNFILKSSVKFRKIPKNSEKFCKIPKNSDKFEKIRKNSKKFWKILCVFEKIPMNTKCIRRIRRLPVFFVSVSESSGVLPKRAPVDVSCCVLLFRINLIVLVFVFYLFYSLYSLIEMHRSTVYIVRVLRCGWLIKNTVEFSRLRITHYTIWEYTRIHYSSYDMLGSMSYLWSPQKSWLIFILEYQS